MSDLGPYYLMSFEPETQEHAQHRWPWVAHLHSWWLSRKHGAAIYTIQFPERHHHDRP